MQVNKSQIVKNFQSMKPSAAIKQMDFSKFPKEVRDKIKGDLSQINDDTLDLQKEQPTYKRWIEELANLYPAALGIKDEKKTSEPSTKVITSAEDNTLPKVISSEDLEQKLKDLAVRITVVKKLLGKPKADKEGLKVRLKVIDKLIAKTKTELEQLKKTSKKKVVKKSLGGFLFGAIGGFIAGQMVDLQLSRKKVRFDLGGTIEGDKKYKYSVTYHTVTEESSEVGDFDSTGFEIENEVEELQDILQSAVNDYGIYHTTGTISAGISFESLSPVHDRDYFEKGIEKYYQLHVTNVDGSEITIEETQFIANKLNEGRNLHWDDEDRNWWRDGGTIHSKDTDGNLVFKADTKGGKYSIEVRETEYSFGKSYSILSYTSGSQRGSNSFINKELLTNKIIDNIIESKKIDGINFLISHDDIGIKEKLPYFEKIWDVYNSTEFKEWLKNKNESLSEEQKKESSDELKQKAIKYVEENGYKSNDSTVMAFFQLFRKEKLIKDFSESNEVKLKRGGLFGNLFGKKEEEQKNYEEELEFVSETLKKIIQKHNGTINYILDKDNGGKNIDINFPTPEDKSNFIEELKKLEDGTLKRFSIGGEMYTPKMKKSGGSLDESPRVYIADLAAYNEGKLVGEWVDLSDFSSGEKVVEHIEVLLKKWSEEQGEDREEFAVHDFEGFPKEMYSEYMGQDSFQTIIDYFEAVKDSDFSLDVVQEYFAVANENDYMQAIENMKNSYYGTYDSIDDFARQFIDDVGMPSNHENYIYVTDTDKRIVANEQADFYVDDMSDDDIIERADMQSEYYDAQDTEDDSEVERVLEEAKEKLHDEIYNEWYDGLKDPYHFLVEEQGIYNGEDLVKQSFIGFDYDKFGRDLENDFNVVHHDGQVYLFNTNFKKGGVIKQSKAQYGHKGYGAGDKSKDAKPVGYRYLRVKDKKSGRLRSVTKEDREYFKTPTKKEIKAYEAGDKTARKMLYFENRKDHSDKSLSGKSY